MSEICEHHANPNTCAQCYADRSSGDTEAHTPQTAEWMQLFDENFMPREKDDAYWAGELVTPRLKVLMGEVKSFIARHIAAAEKRGEQRMYESIYSRDIATELRQEGRIAVLEDVEKEFAKLAITPDAIAAIFPAIHDIISRAKSGDASAHAD